MTTDFLGVIVPIAHHDPGAGIEYRHCPTTTERGRRMTEQLNGDPNRPACVPFPTFEAFREETDRRLRFTADGLMVVAELARAVEALRDRVEALEGRPAQGSQAARHEALDAEVWARLVRADMWLPAHVLADALEQPRGSVGRALVRLVRAGKAEEQEHRNPGSSKTVRKYRAVKD